ncbi:MAG: aerotolerance regulator BatA [Candidatus Schekmanbacteria bacterium RBG_13_48_7]|uniref:Aerotolerance regulator BatA n=1 Tax=Candidatus Schekmanbacteria bacterium RBG_13_48_7 TaxID=1817878 RepID=A0A1F7RYB4_9BACT|nr:MAG: aerotolerance regulator BatA [Candidatus Schekmanbacteria bacterium RBG_13_48_7]
MRFAYPWFLLLVPLCLILYSIWIKRALIRRGAIRFSDLKLVKRLPSSRLTKYFKIPLYLRIIGLCLLLIAFARPQSETANEEVLSEGIDIVLTLDVSGSMRALDFKPKNRLDVAKEVVAEFVKGRQNDRIGLVVFAAKSFTQCPLTLDYGVLLNFLEQVDIGTVKEDGTAIGMALATSANRLKNSKAASRIIILLTDGINNSGEIDPITAAKMCEALKIRVYTIGAGKEGQSVILVDDPFFGPQYRPINAELDEKALREIGSLTGGEYFRATDEKALKEIYLKIAKLEQSKIKMKTYKQYSELFPYFLLPGLGCLLLEGFLINTRFRKLP